MLFYSSDNLFHTKTKCFQAKPSATILVIVMYKPMVQLIQNTLWGRWSHVEDNLLGWKEAETDCSRKADGAQVAAKHMIRGGAPRFQLDPSRNPVRVITGDAAQGTEADYVFFFQLSGEVAGGLPSVTCQRSFYASP